MNKIDSVELVEDIYAQIEINLKKYTSEVVTLPIQPKLRINYINQQFRLNKKFIDIYIYKTVAMREINEREPKKRSTEIKLAEYYSEHYKDIPASE